MGMTRAIALAGVAGVWFGNRMIVTGNMWGLAISIAGVGLGACAMWRLMGSR